MMTDKQLLNLLHKHEKTLGDAYNGRKKKITVDLALYMELVEIVYSGILVKKYKRVN